MPSLVSLAPAFRAALVTQATTLAGTTVLVTRGNPAFDTFQDNIVIGAVASQSEPATLGTNRARQETLTCEVTVYSFRSGGYDQEAVVEARAYELLGLLENYVRVTDTTLGVTGLQWCFLTEHRGDVATDEEVLQAGRMHVVVGTFSAAGRITS